MELKGEGDFVVQAATPLEGELLPGVENNPDVEKQWAITAFQHAETYWKLLTSIPNPSLLKLTKIDDDIYKEFRDKFPDLKVNSIDESKLKSEEAKKVWRPFLMSFEKRLDMFNFLTLLRLDCRKGYDEENTTVVPRIQFLCFEIARIREGHNNNLAP